MRKKKLTKAQKAQILVDRLIALDADEGLKLRAMQIVDRLRLPMSDVLLKVPGESVIQRAAKIGISRQTYYAWVRGASRPNRRWSLRISDLRMMSRRPAVWPANPDFPYHPLARCLLCPC